VEVLTSHCLPAVHHSFVLPIEPADKVSGLPSIGEDDREELRERIDALMDEIENHRDMQLVAIADDPTGGAKVGPNHIFAGDGLPIYSTVSDQSATRR
jgi:hypothetical protein